MSTKRPSPRHEPVYHRFGLVSPLKDATGSSNSGRPFSVLGSERDVANVASARDGEVSKSGGEDEERLGSEKRSSQSTEASEVVGNASSSFDEEEDFRELVEECEPEDLILIETAIVRVLRKENPQLQPPRRNIYVRDSVSEGQNPRELVGTQHEQRNNEILKGLLQQVKYLRSEKRRREPDSLHSLGSKVHGRYEKPEQEAGPTVTERTLTGIVEAAAHAAVAASEAAKAAAFSVSENSAAIESLVTMLTSAPRTRVDVHGGPEQVEVASSSKLDVENESGSQDLDSLKDGELAKVVQKQNRLTHWVLGLMVVTTAIWRFGTVSFVMKLQKKISNPIESIQNMFGGEKDEPRLPKAHKIPGFNEVSSLLQGDPETGKPGILSGLKLEGDTTLQQSDTMFSINHLLPSHGRP